MNRRAYAVHRWLAVIAGVQLLLWSAGGFIFATHDIDAVRGQRGRAESAPQVIDTARLTTSVSEAIAASGIAGVERVTLRLHLGAPVYEIRGAGDIALVSAAGGGRLSPIDRATAERIAVGDRATRYAVRRAALIEGDPPTEYRSGPLPAWRVELDDPDSTHIYVRADTGAIAARRNDQWRRFDFFWMLHTMDYRGRDDFNHPLLIGFAALGIVTVLSGFFLWGLRLARRLRRRRRAG